MRYAIYAKWCLEDMEAAITKIRQHHAVSKQHSSKFPRTILLPHQLLGKTETITIVEGTAEQITNLTFYYQPEVTLEVQPLCEFSETLQLYLELKKERPEKYTA